MSLRLREKAEVVEEDPSMVHRLENGSYLPGQTLCSRPAVMAAGMNPDDAWTGAETFRNFRKKNCTTVKSVNSIVSRFELFNQVDHKMEERKIQSGTAGSGRTRASRLAGDLRENPRAFFCPDEEQIQVLPGEIGGYLRESSQGFQNIL